MSLTIHRAPKLIQFAGDDQPARLKGVHLSCATMFQMGYDTNQIATEKGVSEAYVLRIVTRDRCKRLGLPNPYEVEQ